jgi:hypothetical protein
MLLLLLCLCDALHLCCSASVHALVLIKQTCRLYCTGCCNLMARHLHDLLPAQGRN